MEFFWMREASSFKVDKHEITMLPGKGTNLFNSPEGNYECHDFPFYCTEYEGDFAIRTQVTPTLTAMYDLGCIVIWDNEKQWIKFAYENTDNGYPAMVSVVTRGVSDDCNGPECSGSIWMQVTRKGQVFAMHFSVNQEEWFLARICHVAMSEKIHVGISAQCPIGESCEVSFKALSIFEKDYKDIRHLK